MIENILEQRDTRIFPTNSAYVMYFDGCCKGNPGKGGSAAVIYENGEEIAICLEKAGDHVTNNYAEYIGLYIGLRRARDIGIKKLTVYGDSLLVINQMNGVYKVKSDSLIKCYDCCKKLTEFFDNVIFNHVYRDNNKRADKLSNDALMFSTL